jgi:recombination protein RecA
VAEFDIIYGKGIAKAGEIIDIAIELGIIQKSGSWFSYNGEKVAQGKENTKKAIQDNPELMKELEDKIKLRGKDIDLTADDAYSLDEDDDEGGEDGDDFDIRLLDIENDD